METTRERLALIVRDALDHGCDPVEAVRDYLAEKDSWIRYDEAVRLVGKIVKQIENAGG